MAAYNAELVLFCGWERFRVQFEGGTLAELKHKVYLFTMEDWMGESEERFRAWASENGLRVKKVKKK